MINEYLQIGEVLKPQGVRGQVKVRPDTGDAARLAALSTVYVRDQGGAYQPCALEDVSVRGDFVYCTLDHAAAREQAEAQRGWILYVDRAHASPLPEGAYYISDLLSCRVTDRQGGAIGILRDVLQPGANDVYEIETPDGKTMYLPAIEKVLVRLDPGAGVIVVDESVLPEVAVFAD